MHLLAVFIIMQVVNSVLTVRMYNAFRRNARRTERGE